MNAGEGGDKKDNDQNRPIIQWYHSTTMTQFELIEFMLINLSICDKLKIMKGFDQKLIFEKNKFSLNVTLIFPAEDL